MTKLLRPDNGQPAAFREYRDGMIALDTTCVSSAVRWFTMQAVQVCNPRANVLAAFETGMVHMYPQPLLTVVLYPWQAKSVKVKMSLNSRIKVQQVSLYAASMRAA